jgi:MFS family permease
VSIVNTIMPLILGVYVDKFGTAVGSVAASSAIFIGEIIVAISAEMASFPLMIIGRILYGVGAGCIVTVQEAILAHWFQGKSLAIAIGVQIAISKIAGALAMGTVVPIRDSTGFYGNAFWVSASICGASWLINLGYTMLIYRMRHHSDAPWGPIHEVKENKKMNLRYLWNFPSVFWLVILASFAFGATWNPFLLIVRWGLLGSALISSCAAGIDRVSKCAGQSSLRQR